MNAVCPDCGHVIDMTNERPSVMNGKLIWGVCKEDRVIAFCIEHEGRRYRTEFERLVKKERLEEIHAMRQQ